MAEEELADERPRKGIPVWVWILIAFVVLVPGMCVAIGLFAALVVPATSASIHIAEQAVSKGKLIAIDNALQQYAVENGGAYPADLEELLRADERSWTYLPGGEEALRDAWGNAFLYEPPGPDLARPRVTCLGADGVAGGEGLDRDFDSLMIREGDF